MTPEGTRELADWVRYNNELNPRDRRMSEDWIRPLAEWLARNLVGHGAAVLDFGCGYFDLGVALAGVAGRVDGYDLNPEAVSVARGRVAAMGSAAVYGERDEIPASAYDVIVLNSVLQYFPSMAAVEGFLDFAVSRLRAGAGAVVLADLIPPRYSGFADAADNLVHAARRGLARPMLRHLFNAARMPDGMVLLRIAPAELERAARSRGFGFERLPRNLTPSKRRYTCILKRGKENGGTP